MVQRRPAASFAHRVQNLLVFHLLLSANQRMDLNGRLHRSRLCANERRAQDTQDSSHLLHSALDLRRSLRAQRPVSLLQQCLSAVARAPGRRHEPDDLSHRRHRHGHQRRAMLIGEQRRVQAILREHLGLRRCRRQCLFALYADVSVLGHHLRQRVPHDGRREQLEEASRGEKSQHDAAVHQRHVRSAHRPYRLLPDVREADVLVGLVRM